MDTGARLKDDTRRRRGRGPTRQTIARIVVLIVACGPLQGADATKYWQRQGINIKPPPPVEDFETIRSLAFDYAGRTYTMGGVGKPNFDCSGFVGRVYAESGYVLPRVSRDQARVGDAVSLDALEPGDLIFFAKKNEPISHVALYLGDGDVIHAAASHGVVVAEPLSRVRAPAVSARRILGGDRVLKLDTLEELEHGGQFRLLPMLRRPPRLPPPSFGPELPGRHYTGLGVRSAILTEDGQAGFTVTPELSLLYSDWGLELVLATPVLIPIDGQPTVGEFNSFRDYVRFLRTARLGLRGADLEIALSRLGDLRLGNGTLVDHVVPGTTSAGIPGLTTAPSPLATTVGLRWSSFFVEGVIDDALDPRFGAVGGGASFDGWKVGVTAATDQAGRFMGRAEGLYAAEAYARADLLQRAQWSLDVSARTWLVTGLGEVGGAIEADLRAQYRFGQTKAISADVHVGYLGDNTLRGLFGATYLAHREAHGQALDNAGHRPSFGGEVHFQTGKWHLAAGYSDAAGNSAVPFDRAVMGLVELHDISISRSVLLDIRAVYIARAFARRGVADVAQAGLRARFTSWLAVESYYQLGVRGDGGAGAALTVAL